jgi:hypothetical protein
MVPPEEAVVVVTDVMEAVVIEGTTALVVNDTWLPYTVPAEFVAYART